jgi:hypothetical protein
MMGDFRFALRMLVKSSARAALRLNQTEALRYE